MKLVLFGAGELARLAYVGFVNESDYDVVACALNLETSLNEFRQGSILCR